MDRRAFVRYLPALTLLAATGSSVAKGLRVHTPTDSVEVWTPGIFYVDSPYSLGFFVRADRTNRRTVEVMEEAIRWRHEQMKADLRRSVF